MLLSPPSIAGRKPPAIATTSTRTGDRSPPPAALDGLGLIAALVEARVGGSFWEPPIDCVRDAASPSDPWSILDRAPFVVGDEDFPLARLALLAGVPLRDPATGATRVLADAARAECALRWLVAEAEYRDPITRAPIDALDAIGILGEWRRWLAANRSIVVAIGIRAWKRRRVAQFLASPDRPVRFARRTDAAIDLARTAGGAIATWPAKAPPDLRDAARAAGVELVEIEDGFLRSRGLGVHCVPPQSIVCDRAGLFHDPTRESELERILATHPFPAPLLDRARRLRLTQRRVGIGKYGAYPGVRAQLPATTRSRILILGQVADDRSIALGDPVGIGAAGMIDAVRAAVPDGFLIYRPHPDVRSGLRSDGLSAERARRLADLVLDRETNLGDLFARVDAVHVLTSLGGFEALGHGCRVICHGQPFYAGWGLTQDRVPVARRTRTLTLDALYAGALILYPRYLDPVTGLPCSPELLFERLSGHERRRWRDAALPALRRCQGAVRRTTSA